jgi:type IV pilus biogenesis protein CpaD/CtpE
MIMTRRKVGHLARAAAGTIAIGLLAGCGSGFGQQEMDPETRRQLQEMGFPDEERSTLWDLFDQRDDPNVTVEVNRYLWQASLEILDFMPIEAADPFTGVISYSYGTPPGGSQAYRATVFVTDPALEARSLRVAVQSRSGAVNRETARQIEDAILTRARQLRIRDGRL